MNKFFDSEYSAAKLSLSDKQAVVDFNADGTEMICWSKADCTISL